MKTHFRWQSERVKHSGHNKGTTGWYYIVRGSVQMVTVSQARHKVNAWRPCYLFSFSANMFGMSSQQSRRHRGGRSSLPTRNRSTAARRLLVALLDPLSVFMVMYSRHREYLCSVNYCNKYLSCREPFRMGFRCVSFLGVVHLVLSIAQDNLVIE